MHGSRDRDCIDRDVVAPMSVVTCFGGPATRRSFAVMSLHVGSWLSFAMMTKSVPCVWFSQTGLVSAVLKSKHGSVPSEKFVYVTPR